MKIRPHVHTSIRPHVAFVLLLVLLAWPGEAWGQARLCAGLIKSKGYVVGSPLSASGLHCLEGDTTWVHVGWNHPRIAGLASDPAGATLYLAAGNGVLRTRDGGASWRLTTDWEVTESQDVAVDPSAPAHVYVATAYGVWRSADGGQTWAEATTALPKKYTQTVEVDRTQPGRVLAGTWGGLYVSDDHGHTWALAGPADVPVLDLKQSATEPNVWLAATENRGVLLSHDGGGTWQAIPDLPTKAPLYVAAIDPFDAQHMAAAGWGVGVLVSTDGGKTWGARRDGLPIPHLYEIAFDANVPGRLWAATIEEGIYRSDDDGQTWQYAGLNGTLVFDMDFIDWMPK